MTPTHTGRATRGRKAQKRVNILRKKDDDGSLIYRIDRRKKQGRYVIKSDSSQASFVREIELQGFDSLPSGLYRNGFGFTSSGYYLLKALHNKFGDRLKLRISAQSPCRTRPYGESLWVTLNHDELQRVFIVLREIRTERKQEIEAAVRDFLGNVFPDDFESVSEEFTAYRAGKFASVLKAPDVLENLSDKDRAALQAFYPKFVESLDFTLRSPSKVRFITEGVQAATTVYLEKIIEEFEAKLGKTLQESSWQKFLGHHILVALHTYAKVIEKQSVDIAGKFPDFMLIDPYGYLDIYEIKKPQTVVLSYDKSRQNYYWANEIGKAISQVENYIDHATRNRLEIEDKIRRSGGGTVKILRPRGYIIAGKRSQLTSEKMAEDIRILNDSLKNVDVVFYDDLLDNIKTLKARFAEQRAAKSKKATAKKRRRAG